MERLTMRDVGGRAFWVSPQSPGGGYRLTEDAQDQKRLDRLAAYEDTGLEPEDIDTLQKREQGLAELLVNISCGCAVPYTRLAELAQAEKDGRLVVLPPNDPLTLEQLREMGGEPVWVCDPDGADGMWALVDLEHGLCWTAKGGIAIFDTYGKTWLAYRCRLEEGTT